MHPLLIIGLIGAVGWLFADRDKSAPDRPNGSVRIKRKPKRKHVGISRPDTTNQPTAESVPASQEPATSGSTDGSGEVGSGKASGGDAG